MELPFFLLVLETTFIVVGNAVHPGCECLIFSSTFGKERAIFKSPDYPTPYPANVDCLLYSFVAGQDEIVQITFEDFDVYKEKSDCLQGDYLKVFIHLDSVDINEYTSWENVYCGRMVDIPTIIYSSGPGLVLEFHSGLKTRNSTGFVGLFKFINKRVFQTDGAHLLNTMCDYQFISSERNPAYGKFYSPRYPSSYPKSIRCSYRFRARYKERVRVVFEEMALQRGDLSCLNRADLIKVYDGKTTSDPAIKFLCNEGNEIEVLSTGSELFIEFVVNSDAPGQGFKARYHFQSKEDINDNLKLNNILGNFLLPTEVGPSVSETRSNCDLVISSDQTKRGIVTSPLYPAPYPKATCRYDFQGRGKERVQIAFNDFNLFYFVLNRDDIDDDCQQQDSLSVFVRIDGRMEKMSSFCGNGKPKPVMSNGSRLKLDFHSIFTSSYSRGFNLSYRFVEDFGIKTGSQLSDLPCAFVLNSNDSKTGHFYSPNYPGFYPRDTECHYFFHGNSDEKVYLRFTNFDIEGVLPCESISASDYVEFSNSMAIDRKYRRHCGQLNSFNVESDKNFFRVTFRSNDRLDGNGFNATYQFLNVHFENHAVSGTPNIHLGKLLKSVVIYCLLILL